MFLLLNRKPLEVLRKSTLRVFGRGVFFYLLTDENRVNKLRFARMCGVSFVSCIVVGRGEVSQHFQVPDFNSKSRAKTCASPTVKPLWNEKAEKRRRCAT
ncbi:hypothetical protein TNCV_4700171 [Trichonephila clavipes]|nr:hypothetical protein TNCV_4700171 [Trichonephila clavipes]